MNDSKTDEGLFNVLEKLKESVFSYYLFKADLIFIPPNIHKENLITFKARLTEKGRKSLDIHCVLLNSDKNNARYFNLGQALNNRLSIFRVSHCKRNHKGFK